MILASFHATGNSSIFGYFARNKRILLRRILHKTHELPSPHPVDVAAARVRGRRAHETTRAAELSLSQSAISRQVQTLEDQLGVPLFRREGRSVKLTEVGRRYFTELSGALGRIRGATLRAMSPRRAPVRCGSRRCPHSARNGCCRTCTISTPRIRA